MQVFIIDTPLATAMALDKKRLNKQIIGCQQILDALNGATAWSNHPCVLQYKGHEEWLEDYLKCLVCYKNNDLVGAFVAEQWCHITRPKWHATEYFDQMRRRLFEKDEEHYKQWSHLGKSDINWYWSPSEGNFIKYRNGKRIE